MFKKIISYIAIFFGGITSILLVIARGKGNSSTPGQTDIDSNNSDIRSGHTGLGDLAEREAERLREERKAVNRERLRAVSDESIIKDTKRTVSEIIRDANKSPEKE